MSTEIRNIVMDFNGFKALNDISLKIQDGEFIAILGPSGCGKTTLLRLLAGFNHPTAGEIKIGDQVVANKDYVLPPNERFISMVFQSYALWPHMSVRKNVEFPIKNSKFVSQEIRANCDQRVQELIGMVGLTGMEKRLPAQLSGGQRQRVALARALAVNPDLLDLRQDRDLGDILGALVTVAAPMIYNGLQSGGDAAARAGARHAIQDQSQRRAEDGRAERGQPSGVVQPRQVEEYAHQQPRGHSGEGQRPRQREGERQSHLPPSFRIQLSRRARKSRRFCIHSGRRTKTSGLWGRKGATGAMNGAPRERSEQRWHKSANMDRASPYSPRRALARMMAMRNMVRPTVKP